MSIIKLNHNEVVSVSGGDGNLVVDAFQLLGVIGGVMLATPIMNYVRTGFNRTPNNVAGFLREVVSTPNLIRSGIVALSTLVFAMGGAIIGAAMEGPKAK